MFFFFLSPYGSFAGTIYVTLWNTDLLWDDHWDFEGNLNLLIIYGLAGSAYFCYSISTGDRTLKDIAPKYYSFHLPVLSFT